MNQSKIKFVRREQSSNMKSLWDQRAVCRDCSSVFLPGVGGWSVVVCGRGKSYLG